MGGGSHGSTSVWTSVGSRVSARTRRFSKDPGLSYPLRGALAQHSVDLRS